MDLIASHRQGLIDQLEAETAALAGRPGDHLQRAMVLHHLYDHSRGAHGWALVEAIDALRLAKGFRGLNERLGHWAWREARRSEARDAIERLGGALGEAARARCATAYRAYRLTATPALAGEAAGAIGEEYAALLATMHSARRARVAMEGVQRRRLSVLSEQAATAVADAEAMASAWAGVRSSAIGKMAAKLVGRGDTLAAVEVADRKGWARTETRITGAAELPARFRANPAQHFYAMLRDLEERRRNEWREALDLDPNAMELAA